MKTKTVFLAALAAVLALTTVRAADITPADSSAVALSKEETKAIAEEGFIYGLPIVMNYGVMFRCSRNALPPRSGLAFQSKH